MNIVGDETSISIDNNMLSSLEVQEFKSYCISQQSRKTCTGIDTNCKLGNIVESNNLGNIVECNNFGNIVESNNLGNIVESNNLGSIVESNNLGNTVERNNLGNIVERHMASACTGLSCNIRSHYAKIVELLEAFPLCDYLLQDELITLAEHSEIRLKWKNSHYDANDELIKKLIKREFEPEILRKALNETKQSGVVKLIFPCS